MDGRANNPMRACRTNTPMTEPNQKLLEVNSGLESVPPSFANVCDTPPQVARGLVGNGIDSLAIVEVAEVGMPAWARTQGPVKLRLNVLSKVFNGGKVHTC